MVKRGKKIFILNSQMVSDFVIGDLFPVEHGDVIGGKFETTTFFFLFLLDFQVKDIKYFLNLVILWLNSSNTIVIFKVMFKNKSFNFKFYWNDKFSIMYLIGFLILKMSNKFLNLQFMGFKLSILMSGRCLMY